MTWHTTDLTTLAFIWRLERADGVALGFTSHDRDVWRGGFAYRAAPGMLPSSIRMSDGFDADDVELGGALTSDALTPDDLKSGRWDGARLSLSAVDWTDDAAPPLRLVAGTLGAVSLADDSFSVALAGPGAAFDRPVAEEVSPACRAVLGDPRCRVDLAPLRTSATVVAVDGAQVTLDTTVRTVPADGLYDFGTLRWRDGANAGIAVRVLRQRGAVLTLAEPPALPVAPPVRVALTQGCDRQFATCRDRFANALNFQGEPFLPGNDLLTRYGG